MLKIIERNDKKIRVIYGDECPYIDIDRLKAFVEGSRDYLESEYGGPMDFLDFTIERKDGKIYFDGELITIENLKEWAGLN